MAFSSRVTQKGQATIPANIRQALDIKTGDVVVFKLKKGKAQLEKASGFDKDYLRTLDYIVADEWGSPEDNKAYNDL